MKNIILFSLILPLFFLACDDGDNGGIDNRSCSNSQFEPQPSSLCPVEDFFSAGVRGSTCICEMVMGQRFLVEIGPSPFGDPDNIDIGNDNFGIMMQDCSTLTLFSDATLTTPVGELQNLSSGTEIGSLDFIMVLNQGPTMKDVTCSQCFTGSQPPDCDLDAELVD